MRSRLPRNASRRLTDISLAIAEVLKNVEIASGDDLVFASSWGAATSLETYLASFPNPSPASFQSSVHAGALEAVLVARQQPLRRLQSLANLPETLIPASLRAGLFSCAAIVHLIFAEEYNPWLGERGLCGDSTYACHLRLEKDTEGEALGKMSYSRMETQAAPSPSPVLPEDFCAKVSRRESLRFRYPVFGEFSLVWT